MFEFMFFVFTSQQTRGLSDPIVSAPRLVITRVRPEFDDALDDFLRQKRELRLEHASELRKVKAFVVREAAGGYHLLNVRLTEDALSIPITEAVALALHELSHGSSEPARRRIG